MKEEDISLLFQRFMAAHSKKQDTYFDAEEVDDLLEHFEEINDYTYYDELLDLGLRLHPDNPNLQLRQCRVYIDNGVYDQALGLLDLAGETDNPDFIAFRLECYALQGMYDKVITFMETLINEKYEYVEHLFEYISPVLGDEGKNQEAIDFINRALLLFPDNYALKDELCYNLEVMGDIDRAIEICNELIDKKPYSSFHWFTLGRLHAINGNFGKAIEALDFAITCDESNDELKILKGYCLYMNENYEKAIEVYNEIVTTEENRIRVIPLLAECYVKQNYYEKAYRMLSELLPSDNERKYDTNTYIAYFRCCIETGRETEASAVLQQASIRFPDNIHILSLQALDYLGNGEEEKAMDVTERLFTILSKTEDRPLERFEDLYNAGQYLFMNGNIDHALKHYDNALTDNPDMLDIHLHIAMAYLAKGDIKQFDKHYKQTSPDELLNYLKNAGLSYDKIAEPFSAKHIPPENLVEEFLKNKDNNN